MTADATPVSVLPTPTRSANAADAAANADRLHAFITPEQIAGVRKPLADASFMPPRLYHDADFYDFEIDKVFMRNWLPVGHVSEIPDPDSYFARTLFDEPILVTRNADGEIKAFANVCRHRSTRIATGSGSFEGKSKLLHCPYHGWGYSSDGELKSTPFMSKTNGFDKKDCGLPRLGLDVWQGFIFVNLDPLAEKLSPQLATLDKVLDHYRLDEMVVSEFARYPVPWNWKVSLENFTEGYHQAAVHPESLEPHIPSRIQEYDDVDGPYNLFYMPTVSKQPLVDFFPVVEGLPEPMHGRMVVVNVFPLFHVLIDATAVFWLDWDPRGVDDHDCRWRILVPPGTAAMPDFAEHRETLVGMMKAVWAEDTEACRGVNEGVRSRHAPIGRPCYMEKAVHQFQNWLVDQYEA